MGTLSKKGCIAAGKKREAQENLRLLNCAMYQLRRIKTDEQTHGMKRRALSNCRYLRKVLIDRINDLHTQTYKEDGPNESIDLCSRSADRHGHDDGEQVERTQGC